MSNYGVILDALKRHEEALENFDKVLALRGNDAVAHYNRGNALKVWDATPRPWRAMIARLRSSRTTSMRSTIAAIR